MSAPTVSHSEVENWLLCKRRWYYGYALNLERRNSSSALARGTLGHAVLEAFYGTLLPYESVKEQQEHLDDALLAAERVFHERYEPGIDDNRHMPLYDVLFTWYFPNEPYVRHGWQVLAVEQELLVDFDTMRLPVVIDLIAYDRQGKMVAVDHKFVFDFYTSTAAQLNSQLAKYVGALRVLGYDVKRAEYNMLRTRPLAKSHRIIDRTDQLAVELTDERVVRTMQEQIEAAEQILYAKSLDEASLDSIALRAANEHTCKNCPFRELCALQLAGKGWQIHMNAEYKQRERRTFQTESED